MAYNRIIVQQKICTVEGTLNFNFLYSYTVLIEGTRVLFVVLTTMYHFIKYNLHILCGIVIWCAYIESILS